MKIAVKLSLSILALTYIAACTSGGTTEGGTSSLSVAESSYSATAGSNGAATMTVTVPEGSNAFQLVISSSSGYAQVSDLVGPDGASVFSLKSAAYSGGLGLQLSPVTVSVPVQGGPAKSGAYTLTVAAQTAKGSGAGGSTISVQVISKNDKNLSAGTLRVNMILLGAVAGDENMRSGMEGAVEVWKQIFARANLKLDLSGYDFSGEATAPAPGAAVYNDITTGVRNNSLNVVVATKISGTGGTSFQYGIPGAIGGAAIPSSRSVVTLSALAVTGNDGQFNNTDEIRRGITQKSDDEVRVAGEELAQMAGHYLGLQHVVEISGNTVSQSDFLGDTSSCVSLASCRSSGTRSNFMFPYPLTMDRTADVVTKRNQKYPREDITAAQAAVMNAHVLVD
jgi:hypothetical protein